MTSTPSVAQLADGRHTLASLGRRRRRELGNAARDVYVDNTPPDPVVPEVAGGSGWRRTNGFRVSWTDQPNSAAPITRVHWKLCLADGTCPARGEPADRDVRELPNLHAAGARAITGLHLWLEDAAGNQREANCGRLRPAPLRS